MNQPDQYSDCRLLHRLPIRQAALCQSQLRNVVRGNREAVGWADNTTTNRSLLTKNVTGNEAGLTCLPKAINL
ncbi:hypothetical protein BaRGS_00012478 [Batillaria attramentaria]|uniref:Uncharacterized protein n=1 Tax=Batillaria attramentaria TaxID=370345 RepID=A0ABD0LAC2_9CAEN